MKKSILPAALACLLLATACNKDDDDNYPLPEPQPTSVNGYFSIDFDSTKVKIDSLRTFYLNEIGVLDSTLLENVYSWKSPARRYDSGDTAYTRVQAFYKNQTSGYSIPPVQFSESVLKTYVSQTQYTTITDGKNSLVSAHGFRMK